MSYNVVEYKAGERIFERGDSGRFMYLVQDGEVEVLQEVGDHEVQIAILKRTDFFGEMSILEGETRSHAVRALTDVKLVQIDGKGFKSLLLRNPDVSLRMVRKLSGRLEHTEDMLMRAFVGVTGGSGQVKTADISGKAKLVGVTVQAEVPLPEKSEILIGRQDPMQGIHPDIDLTQIDTQISTSRRHAKILRRGGAFYLQEDHATNGTFINGQRLAGKPIELRSGDEVLFGGVRMQFIVD